MWQILKKNVCVLVLLFCSFSAVYAANSKNITLCIQGTGQPAFVQGFKEALIIEAKAAGYDVTENLSAAKYNIKFNVEFDQAQQKSKFVVSLIKVVDLSEIVSMEYLFADEEEMLLYSQLVFFMLIANLPDNEVAASEPVDDSWRDKWLYISPYFNYSLMFLALKPDGLKGGAGVYNDSVDPILVSPIDNKIIPMPGIGVGLEFQFLPFMSIEPGFLISREEVVLDHVMYNMLASLKIKFPLKFFRNVVLEPYGVAAYPMRFPEELDTFDLESFPKYVFGGGMQIAVKVGKSGALFFDVNYTFLGDTPMKNQLTDLFPKPELIHYDHSVLGFGIGYKFGFFNRKSPKR
jgi:hypothetical protein